MRILFESFLIMLLVGSSSSPILAEYFPAFANLPNKDYVLVLLSALIAFESLYLIAKHIRQDQEEDKLRVSSTLSAVQRDDAIVKLEDLTQQVEKLRSEKDQLQIALNASQQATTASNTGTTPGSNEMEIVSFLSLLQDKGRFIDFIMGDIAPYSDTQVGAAARILHHGCSSVFREYIQISPVFEGEEGDSTSLANDYDKHAYRLIGNVRGNPPFSGKVIHRGWSAQKVELPRHVEGSSLKSAKIITPAEIEIA